MNHRIVGRALCFTAFLTFFFVICGSQSIQAVTTHIEMTPELAGQDAVVMEPVGKNRTRFKIRISTVEDPRADGRFPFVRNARLQVYGEQGLVVDCEVLPHKKGDELQYVFELENKIAKKSTLTISEHIDDGMVGGGSISTYPLINFIFPDARIRNIIIGFDERPIGNEILIRPPGPVDGDMNVDWIKEMIIDDEDGAE